MSENRARDLVLEYGTNSASYQIVNPVIHKWYSADKSAVVGYLDRRGVRVMAGEPVCKPTQILTTVRELRDSTPKKLCVFAAQAPTVPGLNGEAVCIGQQPVWNPTNWSEKVLSDASLRKQFNRARNKGVTVEEWPTEKATDNPDLQHVLKTWLRSRGLPPLHFLVEPETLHFLEDRRTFVALRDERPIAFLNLCPIPKRNGWLTEQFPRLPYAPNGTVDLLMHLATQQLAEDNYDLLTMGMVPLAPTDKHTNASPLIRFLFAWIRAHGRRFYNFDGLYRFKNKFHPDAWEELYIVPEEGKVKIHHLVACAEAFTDQPLYEVIPKAFWKAIKQELRWLAKS